MARRSGSPANLLHWTAWLLAATVGLVSGASAEAPPSEAAEPPARVEVAPGSERSVALDGGIAPLEPGAVELRLEPPGIPQRVHTHGPESVPGPAAIRAHGLADLGETERIPAHRSDSAGAGRIRARGVGGELHREAIPTHGVHATPAGRIRTHGVGP